MGSEPCAKPEIRRVVVLIGVLLVLLSCPARAQIQGKARRIGFLGNSTP
jgi:hypothetical protein